MATLKYAQELTHLLSQWTRSIVNEDGTSSPRLTNQQLYKTTQDVLKVMLGKDIQSADYSVIQTPLAKIDIKIPSAPHVSKSNLELMNSSIGRSLDTLTSLTEAVPDKSNVEETLSKSQETVVGELEEESEPDPTGKKFFSRSSPAIHITSSNRSGTFIRDEDSEKEIQDATDKVGITTDRGSTLKPCDIKKITIKIDDLKICAMNLVSKINDVRKDLPSEATKPIRRLSSIGMNDSAIVLKIPVPPPNYRRSSSGLVGTPTSSKSAMTLSEKTSVSTRRRSVAVIAVPTKQSKLSPKNSGSTPGTGTKKVLSGGKALRSSKYDYVQSTIPKATPCKKST